MFFRTRAISSVGATPVFVDVEEWLRDLSIWAN